MKASMENVRTIYERVLQPDERGTAEAENFLILRIIPEALARR